MISELSSWRKALARLLLGTDLVNQLENYQTISERYALLTENISAALAIHDSQGKITYCSPYVEVLTGYSRKEIYNSNYNFFEKIAHQDDREKVGRAIKVSQYGEAFQFRFRYHHRSGMLMWAETRVVPISDDLGRTTTMLSITIDVTAAVRYQHKVEEHNQDLQDFAYMISHDLKSPLVTVRGMLTAFIEDYGGQLQVSGRELLEHALKATDRLDNLVKSVLEYAQLTNMSDQLESIDCSQVINEIIDERKQLLQQKGSEVVVTKLPAVLADRTMLYQIFANLLDNAIKYQSPERPLKLQISSSATNEERLARIDFSDNGLGIPAAKLTEVFRPFQRAHGKSIEGSGIGLAAVKKLTERLGGQVSVSSTELVGSTFTVSLPRAL